MKRITAITKPFELEDVRKELPIVRISATTVINCAVRRRAGAEGTNAL